MVESGDDVVIGGVGSVNGGMLEFGWLSEMW